MGQQDGSSETVGCVAGGQGKRPASGERGAGAGSPEQATPRAGQLGAELRAGAGAAAPILHRNGRVPPVLPNGARCRRAAG